MPFNLIMTKIKTLNPPIMSNDIMDMFNKTMSKLIIRKVIFKKA